MPSPPSVPARADCRWFALRVRSQCEFKVRDALQARGVDEFLPTWTETVRWSDRLNETVRPLFTGYVFARFGSDPETFNASDAIRIPGVVQILPTSLRPISIPDSQIDSLRILLASRFPVAPCAYVAGEAVLITSGAFAGVRGVVLRTTKGATHLVVRIPMLNAAARVEVEASEISRESKAAC